MDTLIVAGYSGIGKSKFIETHRDVMDYDDEEFPKTENELIDYIKAIDGKVRYITLLTDIDIMRCLVEHGIRFYVVVPYIRRENEFMQMYYERDVNVLGLSREVAYRNTYIIRKNRWHDELKAINRFCNDYDIDIIRLGKGKYFSDAVKEIEQMEVNGGDVMRC